MVVVGDMCGRNEVSWPYILYTTMFEYSLLRRWKVAIAMVVVGDMCVHSMYRGNTHYF